MGLAYPYSEGIHRLYFGAGILSISGRLPFLFVSLGSHTCFRTKIGGRTSSLRCYWSAHCHLPSRFSTSFVLAALCPINLVLSFQPPPPGCPPNAAQLAVMQGANVLVTQRKGNFFMSGSDGGYTIWWRTKATSVPGKTSHTFSTSHNVTALVILTWSCSLDTCGWGVFLVPKLSGTFQT